MLKVKDLTIQFGGLIAVESFNLSIKEREVVGLIGPNGAGKTTIFNMLTGVYSPTKGSISYLGEDIHGLKPYSITQKHIARTFQNIRLFNNLSVIDNIKISYDYRVNYGMLDAIFRTKKFKKEEETIEKDALALLENFNLADKAKDLAINLSYGEQRRLEIARALAIKPKLLLLDEPAAGMNPQETEELKEQINYIKDKFKTAVLLIEHDMNLVMGICEKVVVLDYGKKIAEGTAEEVRNNAKVIEAYLGEEGA